MERHHLNRKDLLAKYALIERRLGFSTMRFYTPINKSFLGSEGLINVQREASEMMRHAGLNGYMPVINFTGTKQGVGGNVELDNTEFVFIEIDKELCNNPDKVFAVMAHEICHKVLFTHGLYYSDKSMELENEILTDLATVYVGFGKLSLNGCYNKYQIVTDGVNTTITETLGYITYPTLVTAYNIVCNRFGISRSDRLNGLNNNARQKVITCFYPWRFKKKELKEIKRTLTKTQEKESTIYKNILVLEELLPHLKKTIKERHNIIYKDLVEPFNFSDETINQQQFVAAEAMSKYRHTDNELQSLNSILSKLVNCICKEDLFGIDIDKINNNLKNVECPLCGYKKTNALQNNKTVFFKCPKCNYLFLWNGELQHKKGSDK